MQQHFATMMNTDRGKGAALWQPITDRWNAKDERGDKRSSYRRRVGATQGPSSQGPSSELDPQVSNVYPNLGRINRG
jgi:hypothetical protein